MSNIQGGTILHAWCWSFNTIKENMKEIAAAGYTAVQTSPVNKCVVGEGGGMQIFGNGKWYYHYQPTNHIIGNYQLGTRDEFTEMCKEAHKYGVKIIVDAVLNHCTSNYGLIDESVKNIEGGAFHKRHKWNEDNRFSLTQGFLYGLYDLNTQNPHVQKYLKDFLLDCIKCGADGFRYDTAKLIELPNETHPEFGDFGSDFWPYVLDNGSEFQYGEDLQEGGTDENSSRFNDYAKYMHLTASFYGRTLRNALHNRNLDADTICDYNSYGVEAEKLISWIESHDNYCNDKSYEVVDDSDIILGWAFITSRKGSTPLFFNRPDGSTKSNPWGKNIIGNVGNDIWKDSRVVEVNKFRDLHREDNETVINPHNIKTAVMVIRGNEGAVIINADSNKLMMNEASCPALCDGRYIDKISGTEFLVSNGKITGNTDSRSISVLYKL